jgi:Methyltransferase domain
LNNLSSFCELAAWFQTPLGRTLYNESEAQLRPWLMKLRGLYLLQVGVPTPLDWLAAARLYKILISFSPGTGPANLYSNPMQLGLATSSVDAVVLPYTLDFVADPEALIHEVDRVLWSRGWLIVLGFHPLSSWGLVKWSKPAEVPWNGQFQSARKICKLLRQQDYTVLARSNFCFRPPLQNPSWHQKLKFMEGIGQAILPLPPGAYMIVARKSTLGLTRITPIWAFPSLLVGKQSVVDAMDGTA